MAVCCFIKEAIVLSATNMNVKYGIKSANGGDCDHD